MARKTPDLNKAVQSFKNMEQAVTKLGASFRSIFAPLSGLSRELQNLAKRSDLSRSTGVSIDKINKFGAAFKRLGGDVKTAGNVFGTLDREWRNLRDGFSSAMLHDLARFDLTFSNEDMADADKMFAKIRKVMADPNISEERKRSLKERLGLDDAAFRLATMSAEEYQRVMEDAASMNFDPTRQREMTKNAEKWREAQGRLSAATEKFKTALADCLTIFTPVINALASFISWLAESKVAVWGVFTAMLALSGIGMIRFVKRIYDIYKALRGINSAMRVTAGATNFLSRAWKGLTTGLGRGLGLLKTTWNWLNKIGQIKITPLKWIKGGFGFIKSGLLKVVGWFGTAWKAIKSFRLASIGSAFARLWAVIKGGKGAFSIFAKGGHLLMSLWRGLKGCLNISKILTGAFKLVGKSFLAALMFAIDGVTIGVKNFKKYIIDGWDDICRFFTETIPFFFSEGLSGITDLIGSFLSGFVSGIGTGLSDVIEQFFGFLMPDSWMSAIRSGLETFFGWIGDAIEWLFKPVSWLADKIDKLFTADFWIGIWDGFKSACSSAWNAVKNGCKSAMEAVKGFFNKTLDWVTGKVNAVRKHLPTWLGGIEETEEEKKKREEEEKKKREEERKRLAEMAQKQYESWSPQQKLDYDFSQVGAATNLPDLRNISVPTVNLPSLPPVTLPPLDPMLKNLEVAGQRVGAANSLAAGASAMMQSTYDYSMSSSSQTIAPSIRIDSINVNAGNTSDPKKLASGLNSELNKYMFYGLEATGAWTR